MGVKAIKKDASNAVLIHDDKTNLDYWIDVYVCEQCKDVCNEWNQYIFHINDAEDVIRQNRQNDVDFWNECCNASVDYLIAEGVIRQNNNGEWSYCK